MPPPSGPVLPKYTVTVKLRMTNYSNASGYCDVTIYAKEVGAHTERISTNVGGGQEFIKEYKIECTGKGIIGIYAKNNSQYVGGISMSGVAQYQSAGSRANLKSVGFTSAIQSNATITVSIEG